MSRFRLRDGVADDLEAILALRDSLVVPDGAPGSGGGFLLGSNPQRYASYLQYGVVVVLVSTDQLLGFGVGLPDALVRRGRLWAARGEIAWDGVDISAVADEPVAYLDQIAFRPGVRRLFAPALALALTRRLFQTHPHLFTTTVVSPWLNDAAQRLLDGVGARKVGELEDQDPRRGALRGAVHYVHRDTWSMRTAASPVVARLTAQLERWKR